MADFDIIRIIEHKKTIESNLQQLEAKRGRSFEEFINDADVRDAVKYRLQTAIQAMMDISNHICARLRLTVAAEEGSGKCIRALEKRGLLSPERATIYAQMIRFRNVLVHLYGEVDDRRVYEIVEKNLDHFRMFLADVDAIIERTHKNNGKKKKNKQ